MKDFDWYSQNDFTYPRKRDYETVFYYKSGKGFTESDLLDLWADDLVKNDTVESLAKARGYTRKVEITDEDLAAFKQRESDYYKEQRRRAEQFKQDLFEELEISDHPKREILLEKAWDRGHAHGYREVFVCAEDLLDFLI